MLSDKFVKRHNGPSSEEAAKMLQTIGVKTMDELIEKTIPASIRLKEALPLPDGLTEQAYLSEVKELMSKNKI